MKRERLHLYTIDMKYIRDLSKADDKIMSVSPQEHKENRPFVGIIVVLENKKYCIPLTSPKEKHKKMKNDVDFSKILDKNQNIIGALNFNNMIPVSYTLITPIDITPKRSDMPKESIYKTLLNNQLDWCNDNYDNITKKANKLYEFVTKTPEKSYNLVRRCCDFQKLEKVLEKWIEKEYKRCNDVLDRNPVLKSKLDAAATEYNRRHNLLPLGNSATIEERCERRAKVLNENPELKFELEKAEKEFDNKHVQQQSQTPGKPKHRR